MKDERPWRVTLEFNSDLQAKDIGSKLEAAGVEALCYQSGKDKVTVECSLTDRYGPVNAIQLAMTHIKLALWEAEYLSVSCLRTDPPPPPSALKGPEPLPEPEPTPLFVLRELGRDWMELKGLARMMYTGDRELTEAIERIGFWLGKLGQNQP